MGYNIYAVRVITDKDKVRLKNLIDEDIFKAKEEILNLTKKIHIGKITKGWQVVFDWQPSNRKYFDHTKESLFKFLQREEYQLIDEEGNLYPIKRLLKDIEEHKNGYDLESYWRENKEYQFLPASSIEFHSDNLVWQYEEFS